MTQIIHYFVDNVPGDTYQFEGINRNIFVSFAAGRASLVTGQDVALFFFADYRLSNSMINDGIGC